MAWEKWDFSRAIERRRSLTREQVLRIRKLKTLGLTHQQIADQVGCTKPTVDGVSAGRTYRNVT